jgi:hypothetical protein
MRRGSCGKSGQSEPGGWTERACVTSRDLRWIQAASRFAQRAFWGFANLRAVISEVDVIDATVQMRELHTGRGLTALEECRRTRKSA